MIPFSLRKISPEEALQRGEEFLATMKKRRSIRDFADTPIPDGLIENAIRTAGTAPNGANLQPWHFAVIRSTEVKKKIRFAAEKEEREFYEERASEEWLDDLRPLGTNAEKPFLETAPALIAIFQKNRVQREDGTEGITYYPKESVGLATGFLIAALHQVGLGTLTHTPSPMKFLNEILDRPASEKPFLLLVVGYPAVGCEVPAIEKLSLEEISSEH